MVKRVTMRLLINPKLLHSQTLDIGQIGLSFELSSSINVTRQLFYSPKNCVNNINHKITFKVHEL